MPSEGRQSASAADLVEEAIRKSVQLAKIGVLGPNCYIVAFRA